MKAVLRWISAMALGAAIAAAVTYAAMKPPKYRHGVSPVEQGVMYRSGQLEAKELAEEIRRRGVKTVINLGSRTDWDEAVCRELGVRYVDLPVGDVWSLCGAPAPGHEDSPPDAPYDIQAIWKLVDDPASRPVLIHCWGGVHRTGFVAAEYRMRYQGWNPDDAIAEMDLYGFDSHKSKFDNVVEYLRAYPQTNVAKQKTAQTLK